MNRTLVEAMLRGERAPRAVAGPLAVHYCARLAGFSMREYTLDANAIAESVARYYERVQPDAVWLSADTWVSAQAMGAPVDFPGPDQPLAGTGEPLIQVPADLDRIPAPAPAKQGRYPLMLAALRRLRELLGCEVFIVACFDQYPFSLACALMGLQSAMCQAVEDRALLLAVMERAADYAVAYGTALAEAGADMLSGGDSPAGLLGPKLYRELALPFEQRVIDALHARVKIPVSLHICGNATPLLSDMARSGADVLELDHLTPLSQALAVVPSQTALWGNLDPVGLLAQSSPDAVARAAQTVLRQVQAAGRRRFVLSSGCTLAMETPVDNVRALIDAARESQDIWGAEDT